MKIKDLLTFLKRFKEAELLINGEPVCFEAYEDQSGKLIVNLKNQKINGKSLD